MRPSFWMILILVVAALLLFGGFKKLPEASRSLGRSLRIFKSETQGLLDKDQDRSEASDGQSKSIETSQSSEPVTNQAPDSSSDSPPNSPKQGS